MILETKIPGIVIVTLPNYCGFEKVRYSVELESRFYHPITKPFFSLEQAYKLVDFMVRFDVDWTSIKSIAKFKELNLGIYNAITYWNNISKTPNYFDSPFISTYLYFCTQGDCHGLYNWIYTIFLDMTEETIKLFLEQDYRTVKKWLKRRARKEVNIEYPNSLPGFEKRLEIALEQGLLRYYDFTQAYWNGKDFKGFMQTITDKSEPLY